MHIGKLPQNPNEIPRKTSLMAINSTKTPLNSRASKLENRAVKDESANRKSVIPFTEYKLNRDKNPVIISKKSNNRVKYVQELGIRYLKPPTPPAPGDIVIRVGKNKVTSPAPPIVIRQQPSKSKTPVPLVIREQPPVPPSAVPRKLIKVSGKKLPPAPRKVVIERLPKIPPKPQSVVVERWLEYPKIKRKVILKQPDEPEDLDTKSKNVIIQWKQPQIEVKKELKYLGVVEANPADYVKKYGKTVKPSKELPDFVVNIKKPNGIKLAAEQAYKNSYELEGDVEALDLVNQDNEKIAPDCKSYIDASSRMSKGFSTTYTKSTTISLNSDSVSNSSKSSLSSNLASSPSIAALDSLIDRIFNSIDKDRKGFITIEDALKFILKLNRRIDKNYNRNDVRRIFSALDKNYNGHLDLIEFKQVFVDIAF